jgi:hypothetical protein
MLTELWEKEFCEAFSTAIASLTFPISFLILQLVGIFKMICHKSKLSRDYQMAITMVTGLESCVESCCQLLLQLFTIIYGYETNTIQKITIVASFVQLAKCSIAKDIETKLFFEDKTLGFKKTMVEVVKLLPCYVSTITFRVGSLCLTMAFLREFSIIPLTLLTIEVGVLAWMRCKKMKGEEKFVDFIALIVSNFGVMTASLYNTGLEEDPKEVEKFVKRSSIVTFIHHTVVLSVIMVLGQHFPNLMCHWTAPMFRLKPTCERFFWMFGTTIMMGVFSLTSILYRSTNIASYKKFVEVEEFDKSLEEVNPEDPKEKVEDIPLRRHSL